jgi:hypothetical protein
MARYYQRMKRQRVYPLVVCWGKRNSASDRPGAALPELVVRPIVPGSLVVPAELPLESAPDATATFQVTPLALGRLRSAHVEVLHQGHIVSTLRLKMIVVRQLISWVLLALAVFVPLLLIFTTGHHKLTGEMKRRPATENEKAAFQVRQGPAPGAKNASPKAKVKVKDKAVKPAEDDTPMLMTHEYDPSPGEVLQDRLTEAVPAIPGITNNIIWGLGEGYQFVCDQVKDKPQLPLYIGAGFLVMAFFSWLLHLSARRWVRGRPLVMSR